MDKSKIKILVVDDEEDIAHFTAKILQYDGFTAFKAMDGDDADNHRGVKKKPVKKGEKMVTVRNKFHELGNWHNKISMAAIVSREVLADKNLTQLSVEELKERIEKAIVNLNKIEQFIIGADGVISDIKPFIYEKLGGDTEIPAESK